MSEVGSFHQASGIMLGHVAMSAEAHARMSAEERTHAWEKLIQKLDIEGAYVPIPFSDPDRDIVGLNLIGIPDSDTPGITPL